MIGAGVAGLHCAYRLKQAGFFVRVYEASSRVGGRMFTARDMFPEGQVAELGGELIDSNHRFIKGLVEEFELPLDDRFADTPEGYTFDTWFVGGRTVPEETVVAQFSAVAPALQAALMAADEDDAAFEALDETKLSDFLDQEVPAADYPELHAILRAAYVGEFGLECDQQSSLNLIYLIGSDDPDPFRIFGESDERYHVHGGNDQITRALHDALQRPIKNKQGQVVDEGPWVETGWRLVAAEKLDGRYRITLEDENGAQRQQDFGHLVFALPFTMLRNVDLSKLDLSDDKHTMIDELGYGTNAKVMGAFERPVWRSQYAASGSVTSDLPLQQTWDSSIGQQGESAILTNFLGGEQGEACGEGTAEAWFTGMLPDLDRVYPGTKDAYLADSAVRMHWPSHPFTRGSYACYRPGQWSFWTLEGLREGSVHFCGEHTSPEFQGWMEGAAETGGRVAKEILDDYDIALPEALETLIDEDALRVGSEAEELRMPFFPLRYSRIQARVGSAQPLLRPAGTAQGKKR